MTRTSTAYPPRATEARFVRATEGARGHTHVQVAGEHFVARGVPLLARLGRQRLVAIVVRADGQGFTGIAEHAPRDGDRLAIGYANGPLTPTDIVYRPHPDPRPVA